MGNILGLSGMRARVWLLARTLRSVTWTRFACKAYGYSDKYAHSAGAVVNVTIENGANHFHGNRVNYEPPISTVGSAGSGLLHPRAPGGTFNRD
jgi:hypothetical protein